MEMELLSEYERWIGTNTQLSDSERRRMFRLLAALHTAVAEEDAEGAARYARILALRKSFYQKMHEEDRLVVQLGAGATILTVTKIMGALTLSVDRPPRVAQFSLLLIPTRNREHLIGDLEEEYRTVVLPQYGRFRADCWYWWQAVCVIGPYLWIGFKRVLGLAAIFKLLGG